MVRFQFQLSAALQVLEATHAVEILRAAGEEGLHVDELARQIDYIRSGNLNGALAYPLEPSVLSP